MKDNSEAFYGYRICLSASMSSLVFHCTVLEGNLAYSALTPEEIRRLKEKLGKAPGKVAIIERRP